MIINPDHVTIAVSDASAAIEFFALLEEVLDVCHTLCTFVECLGHF